jgi:hypothetical protein
MRSQLHDVTATPDDSDRIEWEFVTTNDENNNLTIQQQLEEIGELFLENLHEREREISSNPLNSSDGEEKMNDIDERTEQEKQHRSTEIFPLTEQNEILSNSVEFIEEIPPLTNDDPEEVFQTRLNQLEAIGDHLLQESLQVNILNEIKSSHAAADLKGDDQVAPISPLQIPVPSDISTIAAVEQQSQSPSLDSLAPPLTTESPPQSEEEADPLTFLSQPNDIPPSLTNDLTLPSLPSSTSTQQRQPPPSSSDSNNNDDNNNQNPQLTSRTTEKSPESSSCSSTEATHNLSPPSSSVPQLSPLENVLITLGGAVTIALLAWLYQLYVTTSKLNDPQRSPEE